MIFFYFFFTSSQTVWLYPCEKMKEKKTKKEEKHTQKHQVVKSPGKRFLLFSQPFHSPYTITFLSVAMTKALHAEKFHTVSFFSC